MQKERKTQEIKLIFILPSSATVFSTKVQILRSPVNSANAIHAMGLDWYGLNTSNPLRLDIGWEALLLAMATTDLVHGEQTLFDRVDVGPAAIACLLYELMDPVSNSLGLGQEAESQFQQLL